MVVNASFVPLQAIFALVGQSTGAYCCTSVMKSKESPDVHACTEKADSAATATNANAERMWG